MSEQTSILLHISYYKTVMPVLKYHILFWCSTSTHKKYLLDDRTQCQCNTKVIAVTYTVPAEYWCPYLVYSWRNWPAPLHLLHRKCSSAGSRLHTYPYCWYMGTSQWLPNCNILSGNRACVLVEVLDIHAHYLCCSSPHFSSVFAHLGYQHYDKGYDTGKITTAKIIKLKTVYTKQSTYL